MVFEFPIPHHFGEDVYVIRKCAVITKAEQMGISPASMGARRHIVRGQGNGDSFESCLHGACRVQEHRRGDAAEPSGAYRAYAQARRMREGIAVRRFRPAVLAAGHPSMA
jgi:tRNA-splicing ligase RtcB